MMSLPRFLRILTFSGVLVAPAGVRALTVAGGDGVTQAGFGSSAIMVEGRPAIAYTAYGAAGQNRTGVRFVRAADATGAAWARPVEVVTSESTGLNTVLRVVNGNPAICYYEGGKHRFVRALDPRGDAWGAPVDFYTGPASYGDLAMEVVDGKPAICFTVYSAGLRWVRAADANGSAWGPSAAIDGSADFIRQVLTIVNGHPAVAYAGSGAASGIWYRRALDASGTEWGPRIRLSPVEAHARLFTSLSVVNGRPALCFPDPQLRYTRALDSTGTGWSPPVAIDSSGAGADHVSLSVVDGKPSVAFHALTGSELKFVQAADSNGDTGAWNPPVTVDSFGNAGEYVSMLNAGGRPALVYYESSTGSLRYVRATDDSAGTQWPPDILVERPAGTTLQDGGRVVLTLTPAGGTGDAVFTVRNTGATGLKDLTFTFDGPNAGEFSVATAPAQPVPPGGSTSFTIRHSYLAPGRRTATLHLASNAPGSKNPHDLTIDMVPGIQDQGFNSISTPVMSIAVQPDGRILAANLSGVLRLLADGSLDTSFFSPAISNGEVFCVGLQKDGMILLGGSFAIVSGRQRDGLARLYPDGSLDESFASPLDSAVVCLAVQPDGKILAGSEHTSVAGTSRPRLVRLHPDGSPDGAFNPVPNDTVWSLALQPDGKILAGGKFSSIAANTAPRLARLHPDGTFDTALPANGGEVRSIAVQPDGRILAGESTFGTVMRFFPGGQRDPSLALTGDQGVFDLALQANGLCVVAGVFSAFGGASRRSIARFKADGTLDPDFAPTAIVSGNALRAVLQADGKLIALAGLSSTAAVPLGPFMRLDNDQTTSLLSASGGSTVRWLRAGAAPELRDVTIDVKPDNSPDWTPLGTAHRIPGGWELSGLTLPASGSIRAQGYAGTSVMESGMPFVRNIEGWRMQHFRTTDNTGEAANDADPDNDNLTNFSEFAFGLDPVDRDSSALPAFVHSGTSFTATFTAPEGREDVIYGAEWTPSMLPGTWTTIPDIGTAGTHVFSAPAGGERLFVRYSVRMR